MNKKSKKKSRVRIIAIILLIAVAFGIFMPKDNDSASLPELKTDFTQKETTLSFSSSPSKMVKLTKNGAKAIADIVSNLNVTYPYADMYELEEVKKRLNFDASVEVHKYSALNKEGVLTAENLTNAVIKNNEKFIAGTKNRFEKVEDETVADLCEFIVEIISIVKEKYPDIDWQRVYCNLGNLKIMYKIGMLSYAQVTEEHVLALSKENSSIVLNIKGENAFSNVLVHEIIHIIQFGCECENIENCSRRAGIALYWDDFALNTSDFTWLAEGSAERIMCTITGCEAISYQYKIDYICSLALSVLLKENVKADTIETICLYDDPELLFDAFGCKTEKEKDEILNMMITLQILQMQPKYFYSIYKEKFGIDLNEDEEAMNRFSYSLKPAICTTLTKAFYENLAAFISENEMTTNDLFFLINLFEGHLNQHLKYKKAETAEFNQSFFDAYNQIRDCFFSELERENNETDFDTLYKSYEIINVESKTLNAELSLLPSDKLNFLSERAQWQKDLLALGEKVPYAD